MASTRSDAAQGTRTGAFTRLGAFLVRRRRWVVVFAALFVVAAGAYGGDVAQRLSSGGFSDPSSESSQADHYLTDTLHTGSPNVVLVVSPADGAKHVDDPAVA